MPLIAWSNDLSVNIRSIDDQHKTLVSLVNNLHEAMSAGQGQQIMSKILDELVDYTKSHFATEERLMTSLSYPGYLVHKKEHDKLTQQVIDIHREFKSGKPVITIVVMNFLKDWLSQHIKGSDKKYSPFMIGKGVS